MQEEFSRRLKQMVVNTGMPISKFAVTVEVDPKMMWKYCNGKAIPGLKTSLKIAMGLGTTVEYLAFGEDYTHGQVF